MRAVWRLQTVIIGLIVLIMLTNDFCLTVAHSDTLFTTHDATDCSRLQCCSPSGSDGVAYILPSERNRFCDGDSTRKTWLPRCSLIMPVRVDLLNRSLHFMHSTKPCSSDVSDSVRIYYQTSAVCCRFRFGISPLLRDKLALCCSRPCGSVPATIWNGHTSITLTWKG